jgi:hypothetical protein
LTYRSELIQTAAVACAAVEAHDRDTGRVSGLESVLAEVGMERVRQQSIWGVQTHEPSVWLVILGEEYGEACQAWLDETYGAPPGTVILTEDQLTAMARLSAKFGDRMKGIG